MRFDTLFYISLAKHYSIKHNISVYATDIRISRFSITNKPYHYGGVQVKIGHR